MTTNKNVGLDWGVAKHISPGTSDEPMVPARTCDHWRALPIYFQDGLENALPEIWVRQGVLDRLVVAASALPSEHRLVLLDGWRSKSLQEFLFDRFRTEIARLHPSSAEAEIDRKTLLYSARPSDDPVRPSPHITGGAIDVTLADENGTLSDMGSAFDEPSERSWTAADVPEVPAERRRLLVSAMLQAGFTNLPSEWWHFDYGNWLWAWYSKQTKAHYGPVQKLAHLP